MALPNTIFQNLSLSASDKLYLFGLDYNGNIFCPYWDGTSWTTSVSPIVTDGFVFPTDNVNVERASESATFTGNDDPTLTSSTLIYRTKDSGVGVISAQGGVFKTESSTLENLVLGGFGVPKNNPINEFSFFYYSEKGLVYVKTDDDFGLTEDVIVNPGYTTPVYEAERPLATWFNNSLYVFYITPSQTAPAGYSTLKCMVNTNGTWSKPMAIQNAPSAGLSLMDINVQGGYIVMTLMSTTGKKVIYSNNPSAPWQVFELSGAGSRITLAPYNSQLRFTNLDPSHNFILDSYFPEASPSSWNPSNHVSQTLNGPNGETHAPEVNSNFLIFDTTSSNFGVGEMYHVCYGGSKDTLQHIWLDSSGWNTSSIGQEENVSSASI